MKKNIKIIFFIMALVMGFSVMPFKANANETAENIGLNDYILSNKSNENNRRSKRSIQQDVTLSEEKFNIYTIVENYDLINLREKSLENIIKKTDETLWFIMKDKSVEGMVVTNNKVPIKMGGRNRSIELKGIYDELRNQGIRNDDIRYLEIQGQGVVIVLSKDEVYLTKGIRQLLNLEEQQIISSSEFVEILDEKLQ